MRGLRKAVGNTGLPATVERGEGEGESDKVGTGGTAGRGEVGGGRAGTGGMTRRSPRRGLMAPEVKLNHKRGGQPVFVHVQAGKNDVPKRGANAATAEPPQDARRLGGSLRCHVLGECEGADGRGGDDARVAP